MALCGLTDEFSEQSVCPSKPCFCKYGRIVSLTGLIHESGCGDGPFQHLDCTANLNAGVAGERIDDLRHRPDAVAANVRTADPFPCLPRKN